jgi:Ca-activated chloride channel family protein
MTNRQDTANTTDDTAMTEGATADEADAAMEEEVAAEEPQEALSGAMPEAPPPAPTMAPEAKDETQPDEPTEGDIERPEVEVNPFTLTSVDHLSTFALDVDTASYSSARNYIQNGALPYPGEVRVEEFVNYFDYGYPPPQDAALGIYLDGAPSPWTSLEAPTTQVVRVGIKGMHIDDSERKDAMLIFVIDISGSMQEPNRMPLVKEALRLLVDELRETDQVGIVVYSDDTRVVLEPTSASNKDAIITAINSLSTEGATNVEDGLRLGYELAADHFNVDGINRVILCSDGVANVGETGPEAIRQVIRDHTAQGVLLTTVGFGMGDYNDVLMEQLANDGNGNYAYVDTLKEAKRIFVENLTGMLQVIAKDAKVQVDVHPDTVQSYRLIGYENRDVADEDFRNDQVDAGEVGADHNVTALYEIVLQEQAQPESTAMTVYLRYQDPETSEVIELEQPFATSDIAPQFADATPQFRLAVTVAEFAEQLRESGYAQGRSMADVLTLAEGVAADLANDADVQEFVQLVRQANDLQ